MAGRHRNTRGLWLRGEQRQGEDAEDAIETGARPAETVKPSPVVERLNDVFADAAGCAGVEGLGQGRGAGDSAGGNSLGRVAGAAGELRGGVVEVSAWSFCLAVDWKAALNALDIAFDGRVSAGRR